MDRRVFTVGSLISGKIVSELKSSDGEKNHLQEKIIVQQGNDMFEISPSKGRLLLDAALNQGKPIRFKCRKGTCGQCTVKLVQGPSLLSQPNEQEHKKLKHELANGYRLACQAEIL
ncbi:MAG: (2Fe-2S)-binding protein [Bacillus sp. (in: Bacteria)]|nr:(2Fe-2S)-binding protein [Bacillus sp. (in: firmicutes)]